MVYGRPGRRTENNITLAVKTVSAGKRNLLEAESNVGPYATSEFKLPAVRLPKITLKLMPKQKRAGGRPKKNWMEGMKKAMNERNLNEGQWEDRKQWSLGVGQRRKTF